MTKTKIKNYISCLITVTIFFVSLCLAPYFFEILKAYCFKSFDIMQSNNIEKFKPFLSHEKLKMMQEEINFLTEIQKSSSIKTRISINSHVFQSMHNSQNNAYSIIEDPVNMAFNYKANQKKFHIEESFFSNFPSFQHGFNASNSVALEINHNEINQIFLFNVLAHEATHAFFQNYHTVPLALQHLTKNILFSQLESKFLDYPSTLHTKKSLLFDTNYDNYFTENLADVGAVIIMHQLYLKSNSENEKIIYKKSCILNAINRLFLSENSHYSSPYLEKFTEHIFNPQNTKIYTDSSELLSDVMVFTLQNILSPSQYTKQIETNDMTVVVNLTALHENFQFIKINDEYFNAMQQTLENYHDIQRLQKKYLVRPDELDYFSSDLVTLDKRIRKFATLKIKALAVQKEQFRNIQYKSDIQHFFKTPGLQFEIPP